MKEKNNNHEQANSSPKSLPEIIDRAEIISQFVTGRPSIRVELGEPGNGNFVTNSGDRIVLDPDWVEDDPNEALMTTIKKAADSDVLVDPSRLFLGKDIQSTLSQTGFNFSYNLLEDLTGEEWVRNQYGQDLFISNRIDDDNVDDSSFMDGRIKRYLTDQEVDAVDGTSQHSFINFAMEVEQRSRLGWSKNDKSVNPEIEKIVDAATDHLQKMTSTLPRSRNSFSRSRAARKRFNIFNKDIYPIIKLLNERDAVSNALDSARSESESSESQTCDDQSKNEQSSANQPDNGQSENEQSSANQSCANQSEDEQFDDDQSDDGQPEDEQSSANQPEDEQFDDDQSDDGQPEDEQFDDNQSDNGQSEDEQSSANQPGASQPEDEQFDDNQSDNGQSEDEQSSANQPEDEQFDDDQSDDGQPEDEQFDDDQSDDGQPEDEQFDDDQSDDGQPEDEQFDDDQSDDGQPEDEQFDDNQSDNGQSEDEQSSANQPEDEQFDDDQSDDGQPEDEQFDDDQSDNGQPEDEQFDDDQSDDGQPEDEQFDDDQSGAGQNQPSLEQIKESVQDQIEEMLEELKRLSPENYQKLLEQFMDDARNKEQQLNSQLFGQDFGSGQLEGSDQNQEGQPEGFPSESAGEGQNGAPSSRTNGLFKLLGEHQLGDSPDGGNGHHLEPARDGLEQTESDDEMYLPDFNSEAFDDIFREGDSSYECIYDEVNPIIRQLYDDIEPFFRHNTNPEWESGFSSGCRLNLRALMEFEANHSRMDIWQKRQNPQQKDYAFSLLLDSSGSMVGETYQESTKAAIVFLETFKLLDIDSQLIIFNSNSLVIKDHSDVLDNERRRFISNHLTPTGGTNTLKATLLAEASLNKLSSDHKYMITVTDGCPDNSAATVETINQIVESGSIQMVGLGIGPGTEYVHDYYPLSSHLPQVNKDPLSDTYFPRVMADLIEKLIFGD